MANSSPPPPLPRHPSSGAVRRNLSMIFGSFPIKGTPQHRLQNGIVLLIGTPQNDSPNLGKPPICASQWPNRAKPDLCQKENGNYHSIRGYWGYIGNNGKEHGNHYSIIACVYIYIFWGYMGNNGNEATSLFGVPAWSRSFSQRYSHHSGTVTFAQFPCS